MGTQAGGQGLGGERAGSGTRSGDRGDRGDRNRPDPEHRGGPSQAEQEADARRAAQRKYDALIGDTATIKEHWKTMQQWRIDEGKTFARSRSTAIARMGASGMRAGSQQWQDNLGRIDAAHAKEVEAFAGSATQDIMNKWVDEVRGAELQAGDTQFSRSGQTREEYGARTTEDFMVANFGRIDAYETFLDVSGEQAKAKETERSRQKAVAAQSQQESPWWG